MTGRAQKTGLNINAAVITAQSSKCPKAKFQTCLVFLEQGVAADMAHFAQVLAEVGDFGRFQAQVTILMGIPNFLSAFFVFGQVFMVLDEPHHCSVSWVKNLTLNLSAAEQLAASIPSDTAGRPESCLMFRPPPDNASLEDILSHRFNETQACDSGWVYPENRPPSLKNEVGESVVCVLTSVGVCRCSL